MASNQQTKKRLEIGLVKTFFERLGYNDIALEEGERPDFIAQLDGKRIGIEETKLHPDAEDTGSKLRAAEETDARNGRQQGYWIKPDFWPALDSRIKEKIAISRAYDHSRYDELWLLIGSSIPKIGAMASTTISSTTLQEATVSNLNTRYGDLLKASPFAMVHWYLYMDQEKTLFTWSRAAETWSKNTLPAPTGHYLDNMTFDEMKAILNDPEWQKDPEAKCDAEIKKILEEFKQQGV